MGDLELLNNEPLPETEAISCLKLAADLRVRIKMMAEGCPSPVYGNMLEITPDHLILNALGPKSAVAELSRYKPVEISLSLETKGMILLQTIYLGKIRNSEGRHLVDGPSSVYIIQRRRFFRISPTRKLPAVCVSISDRLSFGKVQVQNVSQDGVCLVFPVKSQIPIGAKLAKIQLRLGDNEPITVDGVVRSVLDQNKTCCSLGIQWDNITLDQLEVLRKYILDVQREKAADYKF